MTTKTTPRDFFGRPDTSVVTPRTAVLSEVQRLAIIVVEELIGDLYHDCGPDLGWTEKTPSLREMESVLFDLACSRADAKQRAAIDLLTKTQRTAICQRVR